jgi:hypothetical protein
VLSTGVGYIFATAREKGWISVEELGDGPENIYGAADVSMVGDSAEKFIHDVHTYRRGEASTICSCVR